jgi:transcriptional regulator with XRE-family HTH domain
MPELKILSRKSKKARKQMKLNQEEFAARCGISKVD